MLAVTSFVTALSLYRDQRFTAAEQAFRHLLASNPGDAKARLYLARTLIELNRVPEAIEELEQLVAQTPEPEIGFQAGRVLRELAERRFAALHRLAPDSAATFELSGERFEWAGRLDEALRDYSEAAKLAPARPGVHYRVGNVLWRKRELAAATAALRKELALTPHHGMANLRMGEILLNSNNANDALPYLKRAVAAMPQSAHAHREMGKAFRKTGQRDLARSEWQTVVRLRPNDDQAHYLLATLYRESGEPELAKQELQRHRQILERRRARPE